ncbi:MAG: TIGR02757 family protein [Candidatus Latescibacteria bacterium]|nr:TIGR02757 family protein [Candidatus Latescibacterota bacterium]
MKNFCALKTCLDNLVKVYDVQYLDSDPIGLVHDYETLDDIEIAGFITASLAYGGAVQIRSSVCDVLNRMGSSPAEFVRNVTLSDAMETFLGFKHRWTDGYDIACLVWALRCTIKEAGSLGALVQKLDNPGDETIEGTMIRLSAWLLDETGDCPGIGIKRKPISYLIPSPSKGSACKRLAMFFRWMVRGPDGIDFGLWKFLHPGRLVIPLDRHIGRMAGLLGLSSRRSQDWKMALEITAELRKLDPDDPLKYDFALVRPGIVGSCTSSLRGDCETCTLSEVCSGING